jgi:hypothetical protein
MTSEFCAVMFIENKHVLQNLCFTLLNIKISIDFAQLPYFSFKFCNITLTIIDYLSNTVCITTQDLIVRGSSVALI